jgi:hypothetical protein
MNWNFFNAHHMALTMGGLKHVIGMGKEDRWDAVPKLSNQTTRGVAQYLYSFHLSIAF